MGTRSGRSDPGEGRLGAAVVVIASALAIGCGAGVRASTPVQQCLAERAQAPLSACARSVRGWELQDQAAATLAFRRALQQRVEMCDGASRARPIEYRDARGAVSERYSACLELALAQLGSRSVSLEERGDLFETVRRLAPDVLPVDYELATRRLRALCPSPAANEPACRALSFVESQAEEVPDWVNCGAPFQILRGLVSAAERAAPEARTALVRRAYAWRGQVRFRAGTEDFDAATDSIRASVCDVVGEEHAQATEARLALMGAAVRAAEPAPRPAIASVSPPTPASPAAPGPASPPRPASPAAPTPAPRPPPPDPAPLIAALEGREVGATPFASVIEAASGIRDALNELATARATRHGARRAADADARREAQLRQRLGAAIARHLPALVDEVLRTHRWSEGASALQRAQGFGVDDRVAAAVAQVTQRSAALHLAAAQRHLAAGRRAAAWLHGAIARSIAPGAAVPLDESFTYGLRNTQIPIRVEGADCPWAPVARPGTNPGGPVATARWSVCVNAQRRWDTEETYTAFEEVRPARAAVTAERQVMRRSYGVGCGGGGCTSYDWETVVVSPADPGASREVQRTRTVSHWEARTEASLVLWVAWGDVTELVTVHPSPRVHPLDPNRDSEASARGWIDMDRPLIASDVQIAMGGFQHDARAALARRFATNVDLVRESDPDAAEEAFARAMVFAPPGQRAQSYFQAHYGVSADTLARFSPAAPRTGTTPAADEAPAEE